MRMASARCYPSKFSPGVRWVSRQVLFSQSKKPGDGKGKGQDEEEMAGK